MSTSDDLSQPLPENYSNADSRPVLDNSRLSKARRAITRTLNTLIETNLVNQIPDSSGVMQTQGTQKVVNHIQADNEHVMKQGGAKITLGSDRPAGLGTGYGRIGAAPDSQATSAVRISTGPMRRTPVDDGTAVDPSFVSDGATLYISDMTDADTNVGFCDGPLGNHMAESSVIATADQIRFFGYNGIQFSTGTPGFATGIDGGITTSIGGRIPAAPKIVFSAGNVDEEEFIMGFTPEDNEFINVIQPIVKGENMEACIRDLAVIIDKVCGALERIAVMQGALYANLGIQVPPVINPHMPAGCTMMVIEDYAKFLPSISQLRLDKVFWESRYCVEGSPKRVSSTNVFSS